MPLHDLGGSDSPPRFDALDDAAHRALCARERRRITKEHEAEARAAAEDAVDVMLRRKLDLRLADLEIVDAVAAPQGGRR